MRLSNMHMPKAQMPTCWCTFKTYQRSNSLLNKFPRIKNSTYLIHWKQRKSSRLTVILFWKVDSKYLKTSYGYINSSYRENFPGHKPEMRAKIVPRVKDEQRNVPFEGESWTKSTYQAKSVVKDRLRNKDKEFNPDMQPFMGYTTYKSDFFPKRPHSQFSK